MEYRFDCVFHYVSDLDRGIAFYEHVFGFRVESRDVVARFRIDGALFELVPAADAALCTGTGNARLTLAVDSLDRAVVDLAQRGVRTSSVHRVQNGRYVVVRDPDDNEIVVWQYA